MTFLEAVNRVLRANGIIKGDDDDIASFTDVQHNATLNLAIIAIQDEVNDLASDNIIPYEFAEGTTTTSSGQRLYTLPADFVRFYGNPPRLYKSDANRFLFQYAGGKDQLSIDIPQYKTQTGEPQWWYFEPGTTKQIGFWHVPDGAYTYTFDYEKSVAVDAADDTMPFHTDSEAQAFCQAAGRRFKALFEERPDVDRFILQDPSYQTARSRLMNLSKGRNPYTRYGSVLR